MPSGPQLVEKLQVLNDIATSLNGAVDVRAVLDSALAKLVDLMGLDSGWIALIDPETDEPGAELRFRLAAHHNLPPALDPASEHAWGGKCTCQRMYEAGELTGAYNEVQCSRLHRVEGDRRGLAVHASAPLRSGQRKLGILNVAACDWSSFTPEALALLTAVGNQMGIAIERAQLYDLLREQRVQEQAALLDLSNKLLHGLVLDDLVEDLLDQVRQVIEIDAAALLLPDSTDTILHFAAAQGWQTDPVAAGRQVPLDGASGPAQVMRSCQPLQVDDLWASDPTDWTPEWLVAEGFRGHAVIPLLVDDDSIGVLVADQRQPRHLSVDDIRLLQLMANQGAVAIEKARLHDKELEMKVLEKELALGHEIQLSLLPAAPPKLPGWDLAAYYQPAREVGGDFYDLIQLPTAPDRLGVVIADVTGKGVPAALFMARTCAMVRTAALQGQGPSRALDQVNALIIDHRRSPMLVTVLYADLDTRTGRLVYANGGHLPTLWYQAATGTIEKLAMPGIILGALDQIDLKEGEIDMAPGDLLVFYTDGVTEAMNARHELFGEERLIDVVAGAAAQGTGAAGVIDALVGAVRAYGDDTPQADDLTLVAIKRDA
ncbi:MAG: SpoIIE family protein phosphatase [Anaerolineae bacterium]|nr:SpoIIE family protein phosphatase [Anaerolineae bacterium]